MVLVPTRLLVGAPGQVLKVNEAGTDPEWAYFGQLDAVYYTAIEGVDSAKSRQVLHLTNPFKTVNFGLQQIENGARNPTQKNCYLETKALSQDEALSWVDTQVVNPN